MSKRYWKKWVTGVLCLTLICSKVLSIGIQVHAADIETDILNENENQNEENITENIEGKENEGGVEEEDGDEKKDSEEENLEENDGEDEKNESENEEDSKKDNIEKDIEKEGENGKEIKNEDSELENIVENESIYREEKNSERLMTEETESFSSTIVASGVCGENVNFALDDKGVLRISGSGYMANYKATGFFYDPVPAPWINNCLDIKSVVIENGVESIGDSAFWGCSKLENVDIPSTISSIGWQAFEGCSSLKSLEIPSNVISIGLGTFRGCSSLENLEIPPSIMTIGKNAFEGCSSLENIEIPYSVTSIDYAAFANCSSMSSIKILNPDCSIYYDGNSGFTIASNTTIYGYSNSTAQAYAEYYGRKFIPLIDETPDLEVDFTTDMAELTYSNEVGYSQRQFNLDVTVTNLGSDLDFQNYEDVSLVIELPQGLSFSQDEELRTMTSNLGTIDNNQRNVSYLIYITENSEVSNFTVTAKVDAKNCKIPQICIYEIPVKGIKNLVVELSPECGYAFCGLNTLKCQIKFNRNIVSCKEDSYVALVEYDTDSVVERYDFKDVMPGIVGDTLMLSFNEQWNQNKTNLSAGTKYYILLGEDAVELDGGIQFGISDKQFWNFETASLEYSLKRNPANIEIDFSIYDKLYGPLAGALIKTLDDGRKGICFGMSYSAGAWKERYTAISSIGINGNTLKEFEWGDKGNLNYSFLEYLQFVQIYQYCAPMQFKLFESRNKYDELYNAIKNFQNGTGAPIIFNAHGSEKGGHAVVPLGICSEDENLVIIIVYNCNGVFEPYAFLDKLILYKENGKFVGWKLGRYDRNFNFVEMDETIDNAISILNYEEKSNLVYSRTEIGDLNEILPCTGTYNVNSENHLYWTDDNVISRAASSSTELSEFGITDGYKEVSANVPLNADITLNLQKDTVQSYFTEKSNYSLTFREAKDGDIKSIKINGNVSKEVIARQTDEGVIFNADNLTNTTVIAENDISSTEKIFSSSKDSVLIKEEGNIITIYEDSDGNGTYDRPIGNTPDENSDYSVSFDTQNHGTAPAPYTGIKHGSKIKEPEEPKAINYVFTGWYKDLKCTIPWDFETDTVNADTILYAGWKNSGSHSEGGNGNTGDNPGGDINGSEIDGIEDGNIKETSLFEKENAFGQVNRGSSPVVEENTDIAEYMKTWWPATPDEKKRYACRGKEAIQYSLAGNNAYRLIIQNAVQGPLCFDSFNAVLEDYIIGRTYNIYPYPSKVYSMNSEVQFTIKIPKSIFNKDRKYRMICVTKGGLPIIYEDLDNNPETITVRTNKFYAYALVYKDLK